ncbi:MAG: hypothetical protein WKG07_19855 [Hymenobacter sp.]
MIDISHYEAWFITGSQHLYGPETLAQVARHSQERSPKALGTRAAHPAWCTSRCLPAWPRFPG